MSIVSDEITEARLLINSFENITSTINLAVSSIAKKINFYVNDNEPGGSTIKSWIDDLSTGVLITANTNGLRGDAQNFNTYQGWIPDRVRYLSANQPISSPQLSSYIITTTSELFNRAGFGGVLDAWQIGITGIGTSSYKIVENTTTYKDSLCAKLPGLDHTGSTYVRIVSVFPPRAETFKFVNKYLYEKPENIEDDERSKRGCRGLYYQLSAYNQSIKYQANEIEFFTEKETHLTVLSGYSEIVQ